MEFNTVWTRIQAHAGEEFFTVRGLSFTYEIIGQAVVPTHTGYPLDKSQFEKAYRLGHLKGPGQINKLVRGPSYIYAILTDSRIR